jgi:ubiquinone/menaquinone biosynthesis C-methylase UbiE
MTVPPDHTSALGLQALTPFYDAAIAVFARERTWRKRLDQQFAAQTGTRIVDIGCGTDTSADFRRTAILRTAFITLFRAERNTTGETT